MNNNNNTHECDLIDIGGVSERMHDIPQTKIITLEAYRILLNATVDLYKADAKIKKLESLIEQKDIKIEHLKTQLETAKQTLVEDFSQVNLLISQL